MKQQHHPWDDKTVQRGANTDIEPEHVARMAGTYIDAQNMRLSSENGADGALSKIGGEVIKWTINEVGQGGYQCIGRERVKSTIVAFWAHSDSATYPPIVTIDGVVMVQSFLLPYTTQTILQLAHSEDCEYGLVFDARSNSIPLYYDIEAIVDAYNNGDDTYFEGLDITQLQVNLATPVDRPRFYGLVDVGDGGGLPAGDYYYALRYANQDGDTTSVGPEVGPTYIPIYTNGVVAPSFPGAGVQGSSVADVGNKTAYGARFKFRVNNKADFERIQLIRIQYNEAGGIDAVPKTVIANEWLISPGQISVIEYVDTGEGTEIIPEDEAQEQRFYIVRANSVRYINYRVVYGAVDVASRQVDLTFTEVSGNKIVPITQNIGIKGHADPVNNCYKRSFMRGEKYGLGIQMYDPAGGRTFVTAIPDYDDYQFPNRRDIKDGDSLALSGLDSYCWAANTDTQAADRVTPTFEVFDHDNAIGKPEFEQFVNIMIDGGRRINGVAPDIDGTGNQNLPSGVYQDTVQGTNKTAFIYPFRPIAAADIDKFGLGYSVNPKVRMAGTDYPYNPQVFNTNNHALAGAMYGVTGFPDWIQGFSVVRTKPAQRVVAQCIGMYWLQEPPDGQYGQQATKAQNRLVISIPDYDAGLVGQSIIEQLISNPENFAVQLVSPLGFCTEQVAGANIYDEFVPINDLTSVNVDMISYARVLWDNGQINPDTVPGTGGAAPTIPGTPGQHYTDFGSWRNTLNPNNIWYQPGQGGGNRVVGIAPSGAILLTEPGGANVIGLTLSESIYDNPGITTPQQWQEPFYVVNIVQTGVKADTEAGYVTCNHYQKVRSVIGRYDGSGQQSIELIDERVDDVLTAPSGAPCYIYSGGLPLLCGNGIPAATLQTIAQGIANNGSATDPYGNTVYGIYQVTQQGDSYFIDLNADSFLDQGDEVEVRYNAQVPIKFFGDVTINPALCARMDKSGYLVPDTADFDDAYIVWGGLNGVAVPRENYVSNVGTSFRSYATPLPFNGYHINPKFYVPYRGSVAGSIGNLQLTACVNQATYATQWTLRQWMVMFDAEMRAPIALSPNEATSPLLKTWPQVNYVQRPAAFTDTSASALDNGVFPEYDLLFPGERAVWSTGGFKFNKRLNQDYATLRGIQFVKKPEFGFVEETNLCSAIVWSARAAPNIQNSPGLRTFPASNIYYIQNDTGTINRLFSSPSGAGFNLYALTDRGVVMVLVNKSVAYSADGSSFSLLKNDAFILDNSEVWISRNQGMPDPWYQTAAEGAAFVGQGTVRQEVLFWYNGETALVLAGQAVIDIAKSRYRKAIADHIASGSGRTYSGVFDQLNDEYWCVVNGKPFVYAASPGLQGWSGAYTYDFDQYIHVDGITYGLRDGEHWVLDNGPVISGAPVEAWVKGASAMMPTTRMEWVRYKAIASNKPDRVEFYDQDNQLVAWLDPSEPAQGPLYLKLEDGWEQYIPRKHGSIDPLRRRIQGRLIFHKTIHTSDAPFKVISLSIQTKPIK